MTPQQAERGLQAGTRPGLVPGFQDEGIGCLWHVEMATRQAGRRGIAADLGHPLRLPIELPEAVGPADEDNADH